MSNSGPPQEAEVDRLWLRIQKMGRVMEKMRQALATIASWSSEEDGNMTKEAIRVARDALNAMEELK